MKRLIFITLSFLSVSSIAFSAAPSVGTITPASGSSNPNDTVSFTTTYSDPDGWRNIQYVNLLINTSTDGAYCFYGYYNQNTNKFYLRNDSDTKWLGGYRPGSSYIIENSYVKLNCRRSIVYGLGKTLRVRWSITFKPAFTGKKNTYLYVIDDTNANSGWVKKGGWTITNKPPSVGSITPAQGNSNPNEMVLFTTTYTDPNAWENIIGAYLLVNDTTGLSNCFYGYYNRQSNKLCLRDDENGNWLGGYSPGALDIIENSYVKLHCADTDISGTGMTLTVAWAITFKPTFTGTKNTYLYVEDNANSTAGWTQKGTWTINIPDTTPPTGSITINDNATYTNSIQVNLTLAAADPETDVAEMQFSNDSTNWSTPEAYNTTKTWTLTTGDGTKTVYVKYKNGAGLWSGPVSDSIILDTILPQIEITSPENDHVTSQTSIDISGTITEINIDTITVNGIKAVIDGSIFTAAGVVLESEGDNTITAKATDLVGNQNTHQINVIRNTTGPGDPGISIDEGEYTNNVNIHLILSAEGATEMIINEAPDFSGAEWEPYMPTKAFTLTSGDGSKTVYVKYRDELQNETQPVNDTITLDQTLPEVEITNPGDDDITNQTQITVTGSYTELNLDTITINNLPVTITDGTFTLENLILMEGANTVTAVVTDLAANTTQDTVNITLDTTPPQNPSISIQEGEYTKTRNIALNLSAGGAAEMAVSENSDFPNPEWEAYTITRVFTLTEGDGNKTVYVKYRDLAQNETEAVNDSIILDTTPPTGSITINNGATYTNTTQVTLILQATDQESGVTQMQFSNDNTNWSTPEAYATTKAWTLSAGDGAKTVYAKYKNGAELWSTAYSDTIILETTPLQIEIKIPEDNFVASQDSIKIWGTINENQASVVVNGINALVGNNQFAVDEIPLNKGQNIITATATDLAGNVGLDSVIVNLSNLPLSTVLIDDFSDGQKDTNSFGYWTGDDQSCTENIDTNGYHKLSWNNTNAYWYSDLWDTTRLPEGMDIYYYERLTFKIKGGTGSENLSLELSDIPHGADFNKMVEIKNYITITASWQEVTIPLRDFVVQGVWKTHARSIVFNFNKTTSGTIYIDDLKLKPCLIDTFADENPDTNSLGYTTGDDNTLVEDIDIDGYHRFRWDNAGDYWFTNLWDGSYEFNAGGFKYLYLRLRGEVGGEGFSVELKDRQTTSARDITNYIAIDKSWSHVYIPLGDFNIDRSKLQKLTVRFNKTASGVIYIDKIGITNTNRTTLSKPISTGPVRIISDQLLVNNSPFQIKGVGYQPTPIGTAPKDNPDLYQDSDIYNRDLPLLRDLGCNTIRTWKKVNSHSFLNACYNNGIMPIYVIMGFPIEYKDLNNPDVRGLIKQEFMEYVKEYKDNPAVLMWALGNEVNMTYTGNMSDWYSLANELAGIAYETEVQNYHPVIIVNMDFKDMGKQEFFSTDDLLTYVDIWGINAYRGLSYKGFFNNYLQISAKPLLITEYGADAWYSGITPEQGYEDPVTQADYYLHNWTEIKNAVGCLGGTLMEYSDEWWKVVGGDYNIQDYGGFQYRYDQPDNYSNEEFWGLFRLQDNGSEPDILIPRRAYEVMKLGFNNLTYPETTLTWEFNTDGDPEGWRLVQSMANLTVADGILSADISGPNPIMESSNNLSINGLLYSGIEIRLKATSGIKAGFLWKKDGEEGFSSGSKEEFIIFGDNTFHTYSIYLGDNPNWDNEIIQLRLTPTSSSSGKIEIDYIRIVKGEIPEDLTPPEDITNLTVTSGNEKVTLNWTKSKDSEGDLADQFLYINDGIPISLGSSTTMYEATGLTNGIAYTFRITCIDDALNESSGATIQAIPRDTTAPEDITNLTAQPGDKKIILNWTKSKDSEGDLQDQLLYIDSGNGYGTPQKLGPSATSYAVTNLNNGQLYRFKLTCIDEVPNESPGVTVQAIPQSGTAPKIKITSPTNNLVTKNTKITVTGTIDNNSAQVTVNGITATVSSGTFTAIDVPLAKEEENQIIAVATYNNYTGSDLIIVYRDTTPPELEVTSPRDGESVIGYP